jgi:hypothetical protein
MQNEKLHVLMQIIEKGTYWPFMGFEPTGKEVLIDVMDIARIRNNQLVEHREFLTGLP